MSVRPELKITLTGVDGYGHKQYATIHWIILNAGYTTKHPAASGSTHRRPALPEKRPAY